MNNLINKFPFSAASSFLLTPSGYAFPLGVIVDANFYPKCQNNPPFHVGEIKRNATNKNVTFVVMDSTGESVFNIVVSYSSQATTNYIYGVGTQNGMYCGSCLCNPSITSWFSSLPELTVLSPDSLIFSSSTVFPIPVEPKRKSHIIYNGIQVNKITWGSNITDGSIDDPHKDKDTDTDTVQTKCISELVINGIPVRGKSVYITPSRNSVVRILNKGAGIEVGKVTDL
jgi:hypothetical protein